MMREVLERRFARLEKEDPDRTSGEWPDLLLIDGGKGQLSAVCEVMEDAGVHDVPVVAVSKGPTATPARDLPFARRARAHLAAQFGLLFYLQRLRDEAHRFAIGTHRAKRAKSLTTSTLDDVPGIGPNRKRALLMHFGTARAVKGAALDDLDKRPESARRWRASSTIISIRPADAVRNQGHRLRASKPRRAWRGGSPDDPGSRAAGGLCPRRAGRRMRPVLMAGNVVEAQPSARTDAQLPQATVELVHSRGPLLSEPLPAAAIEWATVLTATALPEGQPYPPLYAALEGLLDAIEASPSASGWGAALVRYELLLLAELGFGLDLDRCAVTGSNDDLVAVSPKSGRAVSAAEAEPYAGKLLPLPAFVREGGGASWDDILTASISPAISSPRRARPIGRSRWPRRASRLVERLRRAAGLA